MERFGSIRLAVRMARRSPVKLSVTFFLMALIAFFLSGAILFQTGVEESMNRGSRRLGADLMVVPKGVDIPLGAGLIGGVPVSFSLPDGVSAVVAATPGIRLVAPQYFLSSAQATCCESGNMLLVGFDPARDFTVRPWLRAGEGKAFGSADVLIGGAIMKANGASLRFYNANFTVAARLEKTGMGYFDNAVFIPFEGVSVMERSSRGSGAVLLTVPWGQPSLLLVKLRPGTDPKKIAVFLEGKISGVRVLTIPELFREKKEKMVRIAAFQKYLAATAWLLALVAGGAVQFLYWRERRATLGLLQSLGYGRSAILTLFGMETLLLTFTGMVAGSLGALLILRLFSSYFAVVLGFPLLLGTGSVASSGVPWLCLLFAGFMTVETLSLLLYMLRSEPASLMKGG